MIVCDRCRKELGKHESTIINYSPRSETCHRLDTVESCIDCVWILQDMTRKMIEEWKQGGISHDQDNADVASDE